MLAAYYERNGTAREVLKIGEIQTPRASAGEVRVKLATSGVNPSDVKSRQGSTRKIAFPRVIPHSDGAGVIDDVGDGVAKARIGERVWVWNGQWKRAFGTAAEFIAVPAAQAVILPGNVSFEAGACLGIPAMTAIHAVILANATKDTTLLVSGGAGAVSQYVSANENLPVSSRGKNSVGSGNSSRKFNRARREAAEWQAPQVSAAVPQVGEAKVLTVPLGPELL